MIDIDEAARCAVRAELHLSRAAQSSCRSAKVANLDLASIFAARAQMLRDASTTSPSVMGR